MSREMVWGILALVSVAAVAASAVPALRHRPRRWRIASLCLRAAAVGLLAAAIFDPRVDREKQPGVCVVLAEDRSASMGTQARAAGRKLLDYLWRTAHAAERTAHATGLTAHAAEREPRTPASGAHTLGAATTGAVTIGTVTIGTVTIGAVAFGERAAVVHDPLRSGQPTAAELALGDERTDIERAVYRSLDIIPRGMAGRIVLFSDGRENQGDARRAAQLARALGVDLATAPFSSKEGSIAFERGRLDLPRRASLGERFPLRLWVANQGSTDETVAVEIVRDRDVRVVSETLTIAGGGSQLIEVPYKIETRGLHNLRARILNAAGPGSAAVRPIDEHLGFIHVVGPPRVLLIEAAPALAAAFRAGRQFDVVEAERLPASGAELLGFEAVVLSEQILDRITDATVSALGQYVSDAAGGLLLAGGTSWIGNERDESHPLDSLLPVKLAARKITGQGGVDLVIIMDTSGSMQSQMGDGKTAIDVAFDAAVRAAGYLKAQDRLGVLFFAAGAAFTWVKPFGAVAPTDQARLRDCQLSRCYRSGGGINVDEALAEALPKIPIERDRTQHIILISDTNDSNFVRRPAAAVCAELAAHRERGLSLSVIGVEYALGGKDGPSLDGLARAGGGASYTVGVGSDIPSLVIEDLKGRERFIRYVDCPVKGRLVPGEGIFGKLAETDLPALAGYAIASLKPRARPLAWVDARSLVIGGQPVRFEKDDPLLATQAHGLGRVTVFLASPAPWTHSDRLWGQVLRGTARPHARGEFLLRVERDPGGEYRLEVERIESSPGAGAITGRIAGDDGRGEPLIFREDGEGRFWARFRAAGKTAQLLLSDGPTAPGTVQHIELHLPEAAGDGEKRRELPSGEPDRAFLAELGIPLEESEDGFDARPLLRPAAPRTTRVELRGWFFWAALALLCFDLIARRLGGDA